MFIIISIVCLNVFFFVLYTSLKGYVCILHIDAICDSHFYMANLSVPRVR